ncbi:MAG: DJ-1/PfpI family protein [Melioribacteraceae bacterium]|nr:DJ-1/PfpI family protein [Melioribacteraceae bacterium]
MRKKSALIIISKENFNDYEFLTVKNQLVSEGINVFIASDSVNTCLGNDGTRVQADINFYNVNPVNFTALVIIGGSGIKSYIGNESLLRIINKFYRNKRIISAICSAPLILAKAGILTDIESTCNVTDKESFITFGANYLDRPTVVSGNLLTAQSPEAAGDFAAQLVRLIRSGQ